MKTLKQIANQNGIILDYIQPTIKEWLTQKRQEIEQRHYNSQAEYYHAKEPIIELLEEIEK